jgi:hypothetical protein
MRRGSRAGRNGHPELDEKMTADILITTYFALTSGKEPTRSKNRTHMLNKLRKIDFGPISNGSGLVIFMPPRHPPPPWFIFCGESRMEYTWGVRMTLPPVTRLDVAR